MSRSVSHGPLVRFDQSMEEAFPDVDPKRRVLGSRVRVQIRSPKKKTQGGILLVDDVQDTIKWNTQTGRVQGIGPVAFRNRTTLEPWPEGAWVKVGDFVTVPKFGGDRFEVPYGNDGDVALFVTLNDLDLIDVVEGDPRDVIAFV